MQYRNMEINLPEGSFNSRVQTFDPTDINLLIEIYEQWVELSDVLEAMGGRRVNLPEILSEAIFCMRFNAVRMIDSIPKANSSFDCYSPNTSSRIQIKACSVKSDLTSFGPKSVWDELYFIHLFSEDRHDGNFKIYRINNNFIYNHMMNSKQTFVEQQSQGRRPRMSLLKEIIIPNNIEPLVISSIYENG